MTKEKRTYQVETIHSTDFHLEPRALKHEKLQTPINSDEPRKQSFSPELVSRLAERIKKL